MAGEPGKKNNKKKNGQAPKRKNRPAADRTNATRVLANGVGATPPKPFGSVKSQVSLSGWDAKHPCHVPLPRSVGPYTTIKATRRVALSSTCTLLGTFQRETVTSALGDWSEVIGMNDIAAGTPINGALNARSITIDLGGLGEAATVVPSAFSVQVMCPTALQNASGIIYAGVMNMQADIGGRNERWDDYFEKFVQFQSPRLLAASKLALRGVQINSYPLNMNECSKFSTLDRDTDTTFTFTDSSYAPKGWAPIAIFNPNNAQLELLITVEYRVRFDLSHPASASHQFHPVTSDAAWDSLVRRASSLGNGVMDIADVVANTGMAVGRALTVGRALRGAGQLALTG
jgi:hypothetical protein